MFTTNHLTQAHAIWRTFVSPGDTVVDATCGNGYDTLFLAQLLQGSGKLIAYDIQQQAITNTNIRLNKNLSDKECAIVELRQCSHEKLGDERSKLVVYNLGYLPGGDKSLTTKVQSTLTSIKQSLACLENHGMLSITCYPGHAEGAKEEAALIDELRHLSSDEWHVSIYQRLNFPKAPSLIIVQHVAPHPS